MKTILVGITAAAALAAPVAAQETATVGGLRAELRAGYDNPVLNLEYDDGTDSFDESEGTSGLAVGAEVGYDLPLGGAIVGAYAGLEFATTEYCDELFGDDEVCAKAGRNITLGVRAGGMVGSNALLYVKGGYSNGRISASYEDGTDSFDEGENLDGFHLGAGAEVGLSGSTYGKLEYVYTNYDGFDYDDGDLAFGADLKRHQVMVGFGVRF
ncbi:outer membrane protein [Qipengyuania sp.]|uniref:outer membrane protein n=1 Tax=Qipengyuania sp. TaxID=2004515 RepID=UPI0035C78D56